MSGIERWYAASRPILPVSRMKLIGALVGLAYAANVAGGIRRHRQSNDQKDCLLP
jgi:hypothetical protein